MSGRLAVDFGTSNTVAAAFDTTTREGRVLHLAEIGRLLPDGPEPVSLVPSLIHYAADRRQWLGDQVSQLGLVDSARTFRWMKRYIANRSPVARRVDGREITPPQAGADFLAGVLVAAANALGVGDEEIALTLPVEAFEHYKAWLLRAAEAAGFARVRLIDEASAAALGYGARLQPGQVYVVFDFGGGTLDVSVVLLEDLGDGPRRCRVLGKAGADVGGATIDQWLYEEALRRCGRDPADDAVRRMGRALLAECEVAKITLSTRDRAGVSVVDPHTGAALAVEFTRADFDDLLERRGLRSRLDRAIRRALADARERGYDEDGVAAALMVGGSSLMPVSGSAVRQIFGADRVMLDRPLDAVARGAAAFAAGVDLVDHIQHTYALRYINREKGDYDYRPLAPRGTPYPTPGPVARMTVKASHDGQTRLGLAIFEMGERVPARQAAFELVFDPSGAPRITEVGPAEEAERQAFWMNEHSPVFLALDRPAAQGERCFEVSFSVDANKRLTLTATDLRTGRAAYRDFPVVLLT